LDSFHAYLITPPWWCGRPGRHGLSSSDFGPALEQFLGTGHGLWAATVTRLTKDWQGEATAFGQRDLSGTDYVYVWVDGVVRHEAPCDRAGGRSPPTVCRSRPLKLGAA
jgi:hypothetical protein